MTTTQGSSSSVIHYAYNAAGQHTETWTGTGSDDTTSTTDTFYAYDELGRLRTVKVTRLNAATLATAQVTTSFYDPDGNLSRTLLPNGTRTVYGYDDLDHLIWTANIATGVFGDVLLGGYDYNVDLSGRRNAATEQRLESDGTYSTSLCTWTYDNLDRLTTEQLAEYDPQGTNFTPQNYTANYVLDLVGNRLSKTTAGVYTEVITYTYDHSDGATSDDRLMTETATLAGNAEYSTSYGYDLNGSMTSLTRTGTGSQTGVYTYDLQNRLQTSTINSTTTTYGYDANSNRISEKTGSTAVFYLIDNNNPSGYSQTLQESSTLGGTPTTTYTLGSRVLAQVNSAGATLYLMPDGEGSTRLVTDATGTIKARYDFDAFGNALNFNAGIAITKYLYDGQQYDSAAGQYDLRARYYSPASGRFTTSDGYLGSAGDINNSNLYLYVGGNPVNLIDPAGHDGIATLAFTAGINFLLNSVTFGAIGFAWAKARGLSNGQALLYAGEVGLGGGLVSLPGVGPLFATYFFFGALDAYRKGQFDSLSGWEMASYIAAAIALHRITPPIANSLAKGIIPGDVRPTAPPPSNAPPISFETAQTVAGWRIAVNVGAEQFIVYADDISVANDTLVMKNVDIGGNLTNQLGVGQLRAIAKGFAKQYGVSKVQVQGGVRTTGAAPGTAPTVNFDFGGDSD